MSNFISYRVELAPTDNYTGYFILDTATLGVDTVLGGGIGSYAQFVQIDGVKEITISRGRSTELDRPEAGTCSITLENLDERYTPTNTASPYYGHLVPMRQIRVIARIQGTDYMLFRGFIERWQPDFESTECTVSAVDAFSILNNMKLTTSFPELSTGARVNAVLDAVNWNETLRDINTGLDTVAASSIQAKSALQELTDLAAAERGLFFIDGRGYAVYQDRSYRSNTTVQRSFYPQDYISLTADMGNDQIWNQVIDTANDGAVLAEDMTSQIAYGVRTLELPDLYVPTDQKTALAQYLISLYKDPHIRLTMLMRPEDAVQGAALLNLELSSRVHVAREKSGIDADFWVEKITHNIGSNLTDHTIEYTLSYTDNVVYWVLGVSTLEVDTRIGY